jgi:hypothetical protein
VRAAMASGFFVRFLKTFVEDVLVARIADSAAVQRAAVRAADAGREAQRALGNPGELGRFASQLWSEVARQARSDLGAVPAAPASVMEQLLGPALALPGGGGATVGTGVALADAHFVAVLFGASWSAPSRDLAPRLASYARQRGAQRLGLRVVLAGADVDAAMHEAFFEASGLGLALPFGAAPGAELAAGVTGLPAVKLFRAESGELLVADMAANVLRDPSAEGFDELTTPRLK